MRSADELPARRPQVVSIVTYVTRAVWVSLIVCVCFYVFNVDHVPNRPSLGFKTPKAFFLWHPFFMVIGFVAFATEALFAFVAHPASDTTMRNRRSWHIFCHTLTGMCVVLALGGVWGALILAKVSVVPDTAHGFLGAMTAMLYFMQVILGATNVLGSQGGKGKFHTFFGLSVYFLGLATIVVGFVEHSADHPELRNAARTMVPGYVVLALLVGYHFRGWTTGANYERI